jgi:hypothetical protein
MKRIWKCVSRVKGYSKERGGQSAEVDQDLFWSDISLFSGISLLSAWGTLTHVRLFD